MPSSTDDATGLNMYQEPGAPPNERRFKLYRRSPLSLTQVLPMFTHMGVEVVDERPYEISRSDGVDLWVYDFGLRVRNDKVWTGDGGRDRLRELFQDAVGAVWNGRAESDGFNALVLGAGLTWRQVVILRTVAKYLRQTRSTFSPGLRRVRARPEPRASRAGSWRCSRPASTPAGMPARPVPSATAAEESPRRGDHARTSTT